MRENSSMEEFIEYVSKYNPDFKNCIRGATTEEIEKLESYAGYSLPDSYRNYLRLMGNEACGIKLSNDGTSNIKDILEQYEEYNSSEFRGIPQECILVGLGGLTPDICLRLDKDEEPNLVCITNSEFADSEIEYLYSESLEKLIYQKAFIIYRSKKFLHRSYYGSSFNDIGRKYMLPFASQLAQAIGFDRLWFSDAIQFCGQKEGAGIYITQFEQEGITVAICADKLSDIQQVGSEFIKGLGVTPYK
jgi:hypothetical protein